MMAMERIYKITPMHVGVIFASLLLRFYDFSSSIISVDSTVTSLNQSELPPAVPRFGLCAVYVEEGADQTNAPARSAGKTVFFGGSVMSMFTMFGYGIANGVFALLVR